MNPREETNAITILTLLILISVGGAVSIVSAASHVTPIMHQTLLHKRQVVRLSEMQGRTFTIIRAGTRQA